jgi:integrase
LKITSDLSVRSAPPGWHTVADAPGLLLRVHATKDSKITRSWFVRVAANGRRSKFGLGLYPVVTLAVARQKAIDAHRKVAEGKKLGVRAERREQAAEAARSLTLGKAIEGYLAKAAPAYKNIKSAQIRERALKQIFASLHSQDVTAITAADVAGVLRPLAEETARKAHAAIRRVFDYAATTLEPHRVTLVNPADPRRLRSVGWSPKPLRASTPHPALDWRRMPEFMAELTRQEGADARCLAFTILTVARAGAARVAKWRNIDLKRRIWSVPIVDLNDSEHRTAPFIVPLSSSAIELLGVLPRRCAFLFPNAADQPIDDQAIVHLMRRLHRRRDWKDPVTGKPATAHGFRASYRTWAKSLRLDREIAELCLGHVFYSGSEGQYARDDEAVLEARRAMLEAWSRHCSGAESADIIAFRRS